MIISSNVELHGCPALTPGTVPNREKKNTYSHRWASLTQNLTG
jgi:hypothetical protein